MGGDRGGGWGVCVEAPKLLKLKNFQQPPKIFLYFIGEHFKVPRPDAHVNIDVTIAIEFDSRFICYYAEKTMILWDPSRYKYFSLSSIFPYWSLFRFMAIFIRKILWNELSIKL